MGNPTETILFKEKKMKDGWVLNLVKANEAILSTSLYNSAGQCVENKAFSTQITEEVDKFREYIRLFEDGPEKNIKKISKIQSGN